MEERQLEEKILSDEIESGVVESRISRKAFLGLAGGAVAAGLFCGEEGLKTVTDVKYDAVSGSTKILRSHASGPKLRYTEAMYYKSLPGGDVQCVLCPLNCTLKNNQAGPCRTRINKDGKLMTGVFGFTKTDDRAAAYFGHPIMYHMLRGRWLKVGATGCNLSCSFCFVGDNVLVDPEKAVAAYYSPEMILELAAQNRNDTIVFTLNEPTNNFEFTLALAKLAKKRGLKTVVTSNGFVNQEPLKQLAGYIDGFSIGLKGFSDAAYQKYTFARLDPILESLLTLKKTRSAVEVYYILLPGINDSTEELTKMAVWVKENLGEYTPLLLQRFYPSYKLRNLPPTSFAGMKKAKEITETAGLKFVNLYAMMPFDKVMLSQLGDDDHKLHCPYCGRLLISYKMAETGPVKTDNTRGGRCYHCRKPIPGISSRLA